MFSSWCLILAQGQGSVSWFVLFFFFLLSFNTAARHQWIIKTQHSKRFNITVLLPYTTRDCTNSGPREQLFYMEACVKPRTGSYYPCWLPLFKHLFTFFLFIAPLNNTLKLLKLLHNHKWVTNNSSPANVFDDVLSKSDYTEDRL